MTFYQVLTLASIVEREAVVDDERALIAGVYQNRLDNAPNILNVGSDGLLRQRHDPARQAQVRGLEDILVLGAARRLAQGVPGSRGAGRLPELLAAGLPPGPIATPTVASIDAALEPNDKAGYFYFVANPDGGGKHAFAKTYKEHQANLKKYGYR